MGKIYTILIYLMIIPILVCIKNIKKFHNDISSSITRCLVFAIFTILGNGLFTLNINETISYLAMALYLFAYDLMLKMPVEEPGQRRIRRRRRQRCMWKTAVKSSLM